MSSFGDDALELGEDVELLKYRIEQLEESLSTENRRARAQGIREAAHEVSTFISGMSGIVQFLLQRADAVQTGKMP